MDKLLELKKQLAEKEQAKEEPKQAAPADKPADVDTLTKQVADQVLEFLVIVISYVTLSFLQGEKVRKLKTAKAEKSVVDAEVAILLDLKKKLCLAEGKDPAETTQSKGKKSKK